MKRIGRGIIRKAGAMNAVEERYARYLREQQDAGYVAWWAYERVKLVLAPKTTWLPDFIVMRPDGAIEFHDTKGTTSKRNSKGVSTKRPWVEQHAQTKIKIAADVFPFRFFHTYLVAGVWQYEEYP